MFMSLRRTPENTVTVTVNGQQITAPEGQTVWATMALAGQITTRKSALSAEDRSAYCAMGVCFECLVQVDGLPNQQACLRRISDGMIIETQQITETTEAPLDDF
ncbi:(2Fe-2S)-binding protein [Aliisedimentitalea scapharcae]|uniref:(2Fe-2S)-binding protein n=1 Tax=Aliisedimentitalea scapharcae TaxID=1524259 RepID=A0ABZ2XUA9_9RHOB